MGCMIIHSCFTSQNVPMKGKPTGLQFYLFLAFSIKKGHNKCVLRTHKVSLFTFNSLMKKVNKKNQTHLPSDTSTLTCFFTTLQYRSSVCILCLNYKHQDE